jgi:hypothetical protein
VRKSPLVSDHGTVYLGKVSVRVSTAYVLVVAVLATIALPAPWGWGLVAANLLTLPAGTLVLGLSLLPRRTGARSRVRDFG